MIFLTIDSVMSKSIWISVPSSKGPHCPDNKIHASVCIHPCLLINLDKYSDLNLEKIYFQIRQKLLPIGENIFPNWIKMCFPYYIYISRTNDLNTFVRPPFASIFSKASLNFPFGSILQEQVPSFTDEFWYFSKHNFKIGIKSLHTSSQTIFNKYYL